MIATGRGSALGERRRKQEPKARRRIEVGQGMNAEGCRWLGGDGVRRHSCPLNQRLPWVPRASSEASSSTACTGDSKNTHGPSRFAPPPYTGNSSTTACAAMASPQPMASQPSLVPALMFAGAAEERLQTAVSWPA